MHKTIIFIISLFCIQLCLGQNDTPAWISGNNPESFVHVQDSVIKMEIAQFSRKGASQRRSDDASGSKLLPVPLKRCADQFAYFEKGTLYSLQLLIHIYVTGAEANARIEKINLLFYKTPLVLPDSAIADIYHPKLCEQFTKKNRPISADCKAFMSADKRRVYIYMLNGEERNRYEVTWVVQDRKYLTRIVDLTEHIEKG